MNESTSRKSESTKVAYVRPSLTNAGSFGAVTAGSLVGCKKEAFFAKPKFLC